MKNDREHSRFLQHARAMARSYFVLIKTGMLHDLDNKALHQPVEQLVNAVNILLSVHNRAQM